MQAGKLALTLALAAAATAAQAQSYPTKPIRLIIPFAPGGTTDIVGRGAADQMSRILGQPVVVENRAGGGGSIGADAIAKRAGRLHHRHLHGLDHGREPGLQPQAVVRPDQGLQAHHQPGQRGNVIAVNPNFPAKDYKEFLAVLKANPGKYSYASSGTCGFGHMLGEQFKVSTKTFMVHIPYRGAGPALNDVLAGQVPIMVDNLPSSIPYIKAGKLRPDRGGLEQAPGIHAQRADLRRNGPEGAERPGLVRPGGTGRHA